MRRFPIILATIGTLGVLLMAPAAQAQELFGGSAKYVPKEVDRMYVDGLKFLVSIQQTDGSFRASGTSDHYGSQPGVVGLAVVAMLAHGDDPNRGPYALAIRRGLNLILKNQNSRGYIGTSMYNHGFGALALAEAYGQVRDPRLGPALKKATDLILNAQKRSRAGAWRYSPESTDADTTVSGANLVALFAARNAGLGVPQESIEKALQFYVNCQSSDGGFGYTSRGGSNNPRTAIGALMFALAKKKESEEFQGAMNYLISNQANAGYDHYYHYFLYYAAQTYFHASPKLWEDWNAKNITKLKDSQDKDGSWKGGNFGATFATTASLLSLALNYRYLPIYER